HAPVHMIQSHPQSELRLESVGLASNTRSRCQIRSARASRPGCGITTVTEGRKALAQHDCTAAIGDLGDARLMVRAQIAETARATALARIDRYLFGTRINVMAVVDGGPADHHIHQPTDVIGRLTRAVSSINLLPATAIRTIGERDRLGCRPAAGGDYSRV